MIGSPNFLLGHTKIDKISASYCYLQGKKGNWMNPSCSLCQFQSRKTLPTVGNFIEYNGNCFFFLFEMSIHVKFPKALHPCTDHHRMSFKFSMNPLSCMQQY